MAGMNVASSADVRAVNRELPLVPFIDFLLCLVAFLLVTAVWSASSRMNADSRIPGPSGSDAPDVRRLHVELHGDSFRLVWRLGSTVLESVKVPRRALRTADGSVRFPDLGHALAAEWRSFGTHKAPGDARQDEAVLHTGNAVEYGDLVGVLDAIAGIERPLGAAGAAAKVPAFRVSFAVD